MSLSATLFGRDSAIFKATNILGLGIPGWLDKKFGAKDTEGPRLSDLSVQTSTYGAPLPRLYGTVAVMGNLIWLENNQLKERVRKRKSGGKGGGGASEPTTTYSYSATFHIGLCEGPIAGVRRIWCGDRLIYNAGSDDLETVIASNKAASGWKLYLGTENQLPDPRFEAAVGAGNATANRGLAYIAFYDFELADYSNSLQGSQFKIEVVCEAEYSVQLIERKEFTYNRTSASPALNAKAYFVSPEKIVFYAPQWDNSWPTSGVVGVYEFRPGAQVVRSMREVSGPSASFGPPSGDSDQDDEFWFNANQVFPGVNQLFYGPDGYIQHVNGIYIGISSESGLIYSGSGAASFATASSTAKTICAFSGLIYAISSDRVTIYNKDLVVQSVTMVNAPDLEFPEARAQEFNGKIRIYCGSVSSGPNIYDLDVSSFSYTAVGKIPNIAGIYYSSSVNFTDDICVRAYQVQDANKLVAEYFSLSALSAGSEFLSDIIKEEMELCGLIDSGDIDTAALIEPVTGYRVVGGSVRSAIEPLSQAFSFDLVSSGYKIKGVKRGGDSVRTITWESLAVNGGQNSSVLLNSIEMDTQLPAKTTVKYLDSAREYAIGEQYSERLNTPAVNKVDIEFSIVMAADDGAALAEKLNNAPWLERTVSSFNINPEYIDLEVSDVISIISIDGSIHELRITDSSQNPDGMTEIKALPNSAALYVKSASGFDGAQPDGTVGLSGEALFIPLDIPVVDENIQNSPGFVGVATGYSTNWPGALLVRSGDGGQTWGDIQAYSGKGTIGRARNTLPVSDCTLIFQGQLIVDMISGELESISRDQMLSGLNYAAYGAHGRWEIVRFQSATLQADESYLLSGFVRGERGTEWATGLHTASDYFILLDDPDNAFIGMSIESLGASRDYRAVTAGTTLDSSSSISFNYQGVNLECLSPVYAKGTRDGSSNFTGIFTRRSRLSSSWWVAGVQAPVGEASESYEIDVMSGSTVKRTIAVTSPSFTYSAANQTTDFGSAQSSITFRIYQLSELVGRGYPLEVTL